MDAATLQSRIYSGYGKASLRIGYTFTIYRPTAATNPIVSGNIIGSPINAAFSPRSTGFNFEITQEYKSPLFHGLFDATNVNVGDYLVNSSHGTYFVIAKQDIGPILCVHCNNTISIVRGTCPTGTSGVGAQGYSGISAANETPIITSWPCSLIFDARGRNTGTQLPMDDVKPYFHLLLPSLAGTDIRSSDLATEANTNPNRHYLVTASELSPLGWRCVVQLAAA